MSLVPFLDRTFRDEITRAVTAIEKQTSAEIVVVLASHSGVYRDVWYGVGAATGMAGVALELFSPWTVQTALIIPSALLCFAAGAWLTAHLESIVRWLTTRRRRRRQVQAAAHAAFSEEAVHATRERTGLLIYVSLLEHSVRLLPDLGVEARVARADLHAIERGMAIAMRRGRTARQAFLDEFAKLGPVLAQGLPPRADNPNELPDQPRVRQ